jgi:hypothetical protein
VLASFNGTWDWTAVGTLTLAAVTLALAFATFWMVKLTRRSLAQTQAEVALSRKEVEEAHRPVLVPFQRSGTAIKFRGGEIPAGRPHVTENDPDRQDLPRYSAAFLPVENVGVGPALNVRGEFTGPRGTGTARFPTEAIAAGAHGVVMFENWDGDSVSFTGNDPPVTAVVDYDDVAGRTFRTTVVFDAGHNAYTSTFGAGLGQADESG